MIYILIRWTAFFRYKKRRIGIIENVHCEKVKKVRRKIEEKMRKDFTEEKVLALATLLDITTQDKEKVEIPK